MDEPYGNQKPKPMTDTHTHTHTKRKEAKQNTKENHRSQGKTAREERKGENLQR